MLNGAGGSGVVETVGFAHNPSGSCGHACPLTVISLHTHTLQLGFGLQWHKEPLVEFSRVERRAGRASTFAGPSGPRALNESSVGCL
jgi:hypothetical protein